MSLPESNLLTVTQVASFLNVSRSTVYALMDRGQLPSIKLGRARRVSPKALIQLLSPNLDSEYQVDKLTFEGIRK